MKKHLIFLILNLIMFKSVKLSEEENVKNSEKKNLLSNSQNENNHQSNEKNNLTGNKKDGANIEKIIKKNLVSKKDDNSTNPPSVEKKDEKKDIFSETTFKSENLASQTPKNNLPKNPIEDHIYMKENDEKLNQSKGDNKILPKDPNPEGTDKSKKELTFLKPILEKKKEIKPNKKVEKKNDEILMNTLKKLDSLIKTELKKSDSQEEGENISKQLFSDTTKLLEQALNKKKPKKASKEKSAKKENNKKEKKKNIFEKAEKILDIKKKPEKKDDLSEKKEMPDFFETLMKSLSGLKNNMTLFTPNMIFRPFIDIENISKKEIHIKENENYKLSFNSLLYDLPKDIKSKKMLVLEVSGHGELKIEIITKFDKKVLKTVGKTPLYSLGKKTKIPIQINLLEDFPEDTLRFTASDLIPGMEINFKLFFVDFFEMNFGDSEKIITSFVKSINFQVLSADSSFEKHFGNRIQFIMDTSMKARTMNGDEKIDMFINLKSFFPNRNSFDLKASGHVQFGLIKTIPKNNKFYCVKQNCKYLITIELRNIEFIVFFPSIFENGKEITFNKTLHLIEELEINEIVTYKLKVPISKGDWVFSLIPDQGNPHLFINPDFLPKKFDDYKYESITNGNQKIVITKNESIVDNFSFKIFYVTYVSKKSSEACTFIFDVENVEGKKFIKENWSTTGVIAEKEIINYYMDLYTGEPETYSLAFILDSNKEFGDLNLFIKECSIERDEKCEIENHDIDSGFHEKNKEEIFLYSLKKKGQRNEINLKVNCIGNDPLISENKFDNTYTKSLSCMFVIGIVYDKSVNKFGVPYELKVKGNNIIKKLRVASSETIIVSKGDKKNFKYKIPKQKEYKQLIFKVISLTGKCKVYFSTLTKYPNENNYEKIIEVENQEIGSLHTKTDSIGLNLDDDIDRQKYVYVSIDGTDYCVIDIYNDVALRVDSENEIVEKLKMENIVHRAVLERDFYEEGEYRYYYHDFYFAFDETLVNEEFIDITINSEIMGLEICVQKFKIDIDYTKKCDFESTTENLKLINDNNLFDKNNTIALSIRKKVKKEEIFAEFPIEFSISLHSINSNHKIVLLLAGTTHTRKLTPKSSLTIQLNLQNINKNALILLTTHSVYISASIKNTLDNSGELDIVLNSSEFGLSIQNGASFKKRFCTTLLCKVYVTIKNQGMTNARFSLTYIPDDIPIRLKKGVQLFVPSNKKLYFITNPIQKKMLNFNFVNELTSSVCFSKLIDNSKFLINLNTDLELFLTETYFDFKTDVKKEGEIIYNPEDFLKTGDPSILFLMIPKFNAMKIRQGSFAIYTNEDKTRVSIHEDILKLEHYNQYDSKVSKGEMKYFQFYLDEPKDFSVFLDTKSGQIDLFINKGLFNLTTTKRYWKKAENFVDKELVITKDMFKKEKHMVDTYTIGVYGKNDSTFSILWADNFHNVLHINYQKLTNISAEKDKFYYFDFFNKLDRFESILYSDASDLQVDIFNYNSAFGESFLEIIKSDFNIIQSFIYKKGGSPRKKITSQRLNIRSHYIMRIRPVDANTNIFFAVYDKRLPLLVHMEKRFSFAQEEKSEQIFQIKMPLDCEEVDVDVKLSAGSLEFSISDIPENFQNFIKMDKISQKYVKYRDKRDIEVTNDIIIFKEFFIKVKTDKFSKFSIFAKPKNRFKRLTEYETEIIYSNTSEDTYIYFVLEKSKIKYTKKFEINLYSLNTYKENIQLLFNSDQNIKMDAKSPYMPMPLKDLFIQEQYEIIHTRIAPQVLPGYYIIKIPKTEKIYTFKINIELNNYKQLEANGMYEELNPRMGEMQDYLYFLPGPGEFRILIESCDNFDIKKAVFRKKFNESRISFLDHYVQDYVFLYSDQRNGKEFVVSENVEIKIKRGIVKESGLLEFGIRKNNLFFDDQVKSDGYFIMTEFKPDDKELILKDYVDLFNINLQNSLEHEYMNNGNLRISVDFPHFKKQLLRDYDIKKIVVFFNFNLFSDDKFMKNFQKCGIGAMNLTRKDENNIIPLFKTVKKIIDKSEINKNEKIEIIFNREEMNKFGYYDELTIFSHLRIIFVENQQEEFDITLDQKFTDVPFFVLNLDNKNIAFINFRKIGLFFMNFSIFNTLFVLIIFMSFLWIVKKCIFKNFIEREEIEDATNQYVKTENGRDQFKNNKIEMKVN